MKKNKKIQKELTKTPKGIPIAPGTEQETGLTRGETEKVKGPVKTTKEAPDKHTKKYLGS